MKARIISNNPAGGSYYELCFDAPFDDAKPGQFVMVRVGDTLDPLLRRPMSVAGMDGGVCSILYKVLGGGTRILTGKRPGETLDLLGPFGNWFDPPADKEKIFLVGGGVGVAPLLFWQRRNPARRATAFIGGASERDIVYANAFPRVVVATEDGSLGTRGLVTAPLMEPGMLEGAYVLSCGPKGMLKAVDGLCGKHGVSGELSLEERMGCGFGVCLGCVIDAAGGKARMCVDGPVFKCGSVAWRS